VKTLLSQAALDAAAFSSMSATEFLYSTLRSPQADIRWRMEAAKKLANKETAIPTDPGAGAKVISGFSDAAMAQIEAAQQRVLALELDSLMEPLTGAQQSELAGLQGWLDAMPAALKVPPDPDHEELYALMDEMDGRTA
jgi:hypothetical protein